MLPNRSDRWSDLSSYPPEWEGRRILLARMIHVGEWAIEFGCGPQTIEPFLKEGVHYTPTDRVEWTPGQWVVDLNRKPPKRMPFLNLLGVAVFSGVIEYLTNWPRVAGWLAGWASAVVCSYSPLGSRREIPMRKDQGWRNHYTREIFIKIMADNQFTLIDETTWYNQVLFRFEGGRDGK